MKTRNILILALAVALSISITACQGQVTQATTATSTAAATTAAATIAAATTKPATTAAPGTTAASTAAATSATSSSINKKDILIGLSMPTHSDESWIRHANYTMAGLTELGYAKYDVQWAEDVVEAQVSQIENLITKGAKVLIIAAVDGEALTDVLKKAASQGIKVVAYDRLIRNTKDINCYITFDNFKVGVAEAKYIVEKLGVDQGKGPFNIELFGGSSDDNNSFFFYDGAMSVLKKYIDSGALVVRSKQIGMDKVATQAWAASAAQSRMDNLLTAHYSKGAKVDAVLSPYDGLSIGIISSLKNSGYGTAGLPLPIVTGQDAEVASVKSILMDEQAQTVWKDFRVAGKQCSLMVDALVLGKEVPINDKTTYNNGAFVVPSFLCEIVSIDRTNIMELFKSGFYKVEDPTWNDVRSKIK